MGLLQGLVGGAIGAEMIHVVEGVIAKHGGIQGLVDQFKQQGLGATINSWVGSGKNDPIAREVELLSTRELRSELEGLAHGK